VHINMNMFHNFSIRPCFWSIILIWSFLLHKHKNSDKHCYDLIFKFCCFYKVIVMLHYLQVDASFWPIWLRAALISLWQPIWSFRRGNDLIMQCGWPAPTSAWIDGGTQHLHLLVWKGIIAIFVHDFLECWITGCWFLLKLLGGWYQHYWDYTLAPNHSQLVNEFYPDSRRRRANNGSKGMNRLLSPHTKGNESSVCNTLLVNIQCM
jgi:hypothetical protein